MKTSACRWIATLLAPTLAWAVLAGIPAKAQPQANEVAASARIYGYDLAAGNWISEPVKCSLMPDVALIHYRESFPDGTESRFTAIVPSEEGRVRIVPVLYHNATPFIPAPRNPRNYALFNQLVRGRAAKGTWLDLSACYAALTGAGSGLRSELGIAGAPSPTTRVDPQGKIHRVTFATREVQSGYEVWSVSFDRHGRVTNVSTEEESVYAAKAPPPVVHRTARKHRERAAVKPHPRKPQERAAVRPATLSRTAPAFGTQVNSVPAFDAQTTPPQQQPSSSEEAGWKFIPTPPEPPSKIIPEARQPREAASPNP